MFLHYKNILVSQVPWVNIGNSKMDRKNIIENTYNYILANNCTGGDQIIINSRVYRCE